MTEFRQTFSVDAFWDKYERVKFLWSKITGQGHNMTKAQRVEAYRARWWTLSSNFFLVLLTDNLHSVLLLAYIFFISGTLKQIDD